MRSTIICRFDKKEDLDDFNKLNDYALTPNTKEFNVHTLEQKIKKQVKSKGNKKEETWKKHWVDMPEFICEKKKIYAQINFVFDENDTTEFASKVLHQNISERTTSVWFPKLVQGTYTTLRVVGGESATRYPIYVVSKDRSDNCYTSQFLSQMQVPHFVVVEPNDYELYQAKVANQYATILKLDMKYKDEYDTFDDLGDTKGKGPGGARNFVWDDSIKRGYAWHWVFDDNANEGFHYFWRGLKVKCRSGAFFRAIEDFVDRYENIAQAGLNYTKFCIMGEKYPAFVTNTRIYSFLLIRNDIPYRWRGRYNEDTDLSLRILKDGWCTVQFNAFTAGKATTQKIKGGNTEMFYSKEGTYPKSKMLQDMHPDVAKVVWKFNRWHHEVNYRGFTQELKLKPDYQPKQQINNYGMVIIDTQEKEVTDTKDYLETKYALDIIYNPLNNLINESNKENNQSELEQINIFDYKQ